MSRQRLQASRGGYCAAPQPPHTCSAKRPSAANAVIIVAARLREDGGLTGTRVRICGSFLGGGASGSVIAGVSGGCNDRGARAKPAVKVDHAKSTDQRRLGILDLCRPGAVGDLTHGLHQPKITARGAGLSG